MLTKNSNAGDHYDPFLACSASSQDKTTLCPALSRTSPSYIYNCHPNTFSTGNWSACELGDISGKFGHMSAVAAGGKIFTGSAGSDPMPPLLFNYNHSSTLSHPWNSVVVASVRSRVPAGR